MMPVTDNEKVKREEQLGRYLYWLNQLKIHHYNLHQQHPNDSRDDPSTAFGAAYQLLNILNGYALSYKNQEIDLECLKKNSSRVIQERRNGVLGQHRGSREILTNLLFALGTFGIGYALAAFFTQSFTPIKCKTNTVNILDATEETLVKLE
jgi:hypothetical protein